MRPSVSELLDDLAGRLATQAPARREAFARDVLNRRRFLPCGARTKADHPCPMRANLSGRCHVHEGKDPRR